MANIPSYVLVFTDAMPETESHEQQVEWPADVLQQSDKEPQETAANETTVGMSKLS